MAFGGRLGSSREATDIALLTLAQCTGVRGLMISKTGNGRENVRFVRLIPIARMVGVGVGQLVDDDNDECLPLSSSVSEFGRYERCSSDGR